MQLFCLCRAILLGSKIIVLDEPTSNLDIETDAMIQNLIRTIFEGCTVITIAHRIATILDYDAVLVMDNGEAKEFGHPRSLLSNPKSAFASLANGIQE
jgi:ATP-binding cassette subfamily C (CFTR/MRP) protein 1